MGDYCKLIVSCAVKREIKEDLESKIQELGLCTSAYQSQEYMVSIKPSERGSRGDELLVVIVGQTKWGDRQNGFCEWLRPLF